MAKSAPTLRRGSMVLLRTNGGDHPCIMLTDPYKTLGHGTSKIIQVHLTSSKDRSKYDSTCTFKAWRGGADAGSAARRGEGRTGSRKDPLITKDCWVRYEMMAIKKVADIEAEVVKRNRTVRMLSRDIYIRIIEGVLTSPLTPPRVRELFEDALRRGFAG